MSFGAASTRDHNLQQPPDGRLLREKSKIFVECQEWASGFSNLSAPDLARLHFHPCSIASLAWLRVQGPEGAKPSLWSVIPAHA